MSRIHCPNSPVSSLKISTSIVAGRLTVVKTIIQPTHYRGSLFSSVIILDSSASKSFAHALNLKNQFLNLMGHLQP